MPATMNVNYRYNIEAPASDVLAIFNLLPVENRDAVFTALREATTLNDTVRFEFVDSSLAERVVSLINSGQEIGTISGELFPVQSFTDSDLLYYVTVLKNANGDVVANACTCPDYVHRGNQCKHIDYVLDTQVNV